jgi:hypothetical protein
MADMNNKEIPKSGTYCRYCGSKNDVDAIWCQSCGKKIRGEDNQSLVANEVRTTPEKEYSSWYNAEISRFKVPNSHRSRNIMIGVFAVIMVVIMVTALASFGAPKTTITGINLQVEYPYMNTDPSYFGSVSQSVTISNQPNKVLEISQGQQFYVSFPFTESYLATGSHSINQIRAITPGFTVLSVDPQIPISFSPGSTIIITVTLQSPNSYFTGAINLAISTT